LPAPVSFSLLYHFCRHLVKLPTEEIKELLGERLTDVTLDFYNFICDKLPPTPSRFHYVFNLRDLSRIYEGLLLSTADKFTSAQVRERKYGIRGRRVRVRGGNLLFSPALLQPSFSKHSNGCGQGTRITLSYTHSLFLTHSHANSPPSISPLPHVQEFLRLWRNEAMRVFHDRLICAEDKALALTKLTELVENKFPSCAQHTLADPILFGDFRAAGLEDASELR
jgi:hypothetical protein